MIASGNKTYPLYPQGHDTTTSAVCFALYNIAKYPEVQDKILAEIRSLCGSDTTKPLTFS